MKQVTVLFTVLVIGLSTVSAQEGKEKNWV